MILILSNKNRANQISAHIHNFLLENRSDYNATHWQDEKKHPSRNEYAVFIHPDLEELAVRYDIESLLPEAMSVVDKLPEDWEVVEEL